ncbi:MAG: hypothetical protein ACREMR_04535, partial [Gemmatimonadales bacterium]
LDLIPDRRCRVERRGGERRGGADALSVERRTGTDRRHRTERRESAGGHVRNAIQLLEFLLAQPGLADRERLELAAVTRRLWLALWEIERPGRGPGGRSSR